MTNKRRTAPIYLLSFLIPAFIMTLVCLTLNIYPFGGKTLLISDMSNQYVSFLSYFRTLFSGNDVFYTFSKSLGGDMAGLLSYYLFSPFNLITLPFSTEALPLAVNIIIVSKIAACGFTFCIYLGKSFGLRRSSLLFSSAYALMAYNLAYCFNIMWLDGVILLPLIILGINGIFERKSALGYLLALSAALVTNYYIGFMLCIFSVLYFIYRFFVTLSRENLRQTLKAAAPYALSSIAAAGLAAVVLIPAFYSLKDGKAYFSFEALTLTPNFAFTDVFSKLFTGAFSWDEEIAGLPNIFCGIPVLILALQYFLNGAVRLRERICSALLAAALLLSFYITMFNLVWHGFAPPSWFLYRYSFVFSFVVITLAYRNYLNLSTLTPSRIICAALVFIGCAAFVADKNFAFLSHDFIYLDVLLAAIASALVYACARIEYRTAKKPAPYIDPALSPVPVLRKKPGRTLPVVIALLAVMQLGNLWLNAYHTIGKLNEVFCEDVSYFTEYARNTGKTIGGVKSGDGGFYRIEKTFIYNMNDSMLFDYAGITHFSSTQKNPIKAFLEKLGFRNYYDYWVFYGSGSTVWADSLLGVKYLITDTGTIKPYETVSDENGVTVLRNPYALPLGFAAPADAGSVDLSGETSLFEAQNSIFRGLAPQNTGDIFTPAPAHISLVNATEQNVDGCRVYTKTDASKDAFVDYEISITSTDTLYCYLYAPDIQDAEIFVNGEPRGRYFDTYKWNIFAVGSFAPGDTVTVRVKLLGEKLSVLREEFYYESMEALRRCHEALSGGFCSLAKISSSHIEGTVNVEGENKLIVFTIPYESAWSVYIDGEPAQVSPVFGALLGAHVSPGSHSIELRYIPEGFWLGLAVSGASLLAVVMYAVLRIRAKSRENKKGIMIRL
ncbi:MAG: YfhO family protein [Burkholderiales bacterium]